MYFRGHWWAGDWLEAWKIEGITRDLTFLDFFPIWVAIVLWGKDMRDSTIHFWCDNQVVVHVINSLTSKSHQVMGLVRGFILRCLRFNIFFLVRHVPGLDNGVADALSHKQMWRFHQLAPAADLPPVQLPEEVWSIGG